MDRFACRQANARILAAVVRILEVPEERVTMNGDRVGNTVAASIPLVLADAAAAGDILGAGLGWDSTVITWPPVDLG